MRTLIIAGTAVGLLLGVAFAVARHHVLMVQGDVGWFAYSPRSGEARVPETGETDWWPAVILGPMGGALLGAGGGGLLGRLGWRLTRTTA